jgi:hypothetical protein
MIAFDKGLENKRPPYGKVYSVKKGNSGFHGSAFEG